MPIARWFCNLALWATPLSLASTGCGDAPGEQTDTQPGITTATTTTTSPASETSEATTDTTTDASGSTTQTPTTGVPTTTSDPTTGPTTTTAGETEQTTGEPLPCDDRFAFDPDPPGTGTFLKVLVSDPEPLVFVDLQASGPGQASIMFDDVVANNPFTWAWDVTSLAEGVWTFTFLAGDPQQTVGQCQVYVHDTGEPPPPPMGDCDGKVCGDDDGNGGYCQTCPMVGECLDPPSPYGPSPDQSPWECLDNAGCHEESGNCTIWCPGEPCNMEAHPDGCPQGVESCFVSASYTSYEEACKACCESRFHEPTQEYACWDEAHSLCRYPTDCGLPLWP